MMDELLDHIWDKTSVVLQALSGMLDQAFQPFHCFGPGFTIVVIVIVTVAVTKILGKIYQPKRYLKLQKEFEYWYNLRQEAMKCEDAEKAKLLAKNIDDANLNKVYYDYFFEGLLKNLLTSYIPILTMLAYVNDTYRPEKLLATFGQDHIFKFTWLNGKQVIVGSVFWFVLSLLTVLILWSVVRRLLLRIRKTPPMSSEQLAK